MENTQKALEAARARYSRLVVALNAFQTELSRTPEDALPPWSKLQSHFNLLAASLDSLSVMQQQYFPPNAPTLLASYPTPSFPAAYHATVVPALLNKMWPEDLKESATAALAADSSGGGGDKVRRAEEDALWAAAHDIVMVHQAERNWDADLLTNEEVDAGVELESLIGVGLAGKMDDADKEEKEKEKEARPPATLDGLLRFMCTGVPLEKQNPLPTVTIQGAGLKRS